MAKRLLHIAIEFENIDAVEHLTMLGVDINVADEFGQTPLAMAIKIGSNPIVQYLCVMRANINVYCDNKTPLIIAVVHNKIDIINTLFAHGALVDKETCLFCDTALHYACVYNRLEIIKLLLLHNANPNHRNICSLTPRDIYLENNPNGKLF